MKFQVIQGQSKWHYWRRRI